MGEEAQQSETSNSKNTLAECSEETHALGSSESELKQSTELRVPDANHMSADASRLLHALQKGEASHGNISARQ